jgi:hypothetical protein
MSANQTSSVTQISTDGPENFVIIKVEASAAHLMLMMVMMMMMMMVVFWQVSRIDIEHHSRCAHQNSIAPDTKN